MNLFVRLVQRGAERKLRVPADYIGRMGETSFSGFLKFLGFLACGGPPAQGRQGRGARGEDRGHSARGLRAVRADRSQRRARRGRRAPDDPSVAEARLRRATERRLSRGPDSPRVFWPTTVRRTRRAGRSRASSAARFSRSSPWRSPPLVSSRRSSGEWVLRRAARWPTSRSSQPASQAELSAGSPRTNG